MIPIKGQSETPKASDSCNFYTPIPILGYISHNHLDFKILFHQNLLRFRRQQHADENFGVTTNSRLLLLSLSTSASCDLVIFLSYCNRSSYRPLQNVPFLSDLSHRAQRSLCFIPYIALHMLWYFNLGIKVWLAFLFMKSVVS